jgi:hypothetical protein
MAPVTSELSGVNELCVIIVFGACLASDDVIAEDSPRDFASGSGFPMGIRKVTIPIKVTVIPKVTMVTKVTWGIPHPVPSARKDMYGSSCEVHVIFVRFQVKL